MKSLDHRSTIYGTLLVMTWLWAAVAGAQVPPSEEPNERESKTAPAPPEETQPADGKPPETTAGSEQGPTNAQPAKPTPRENVLPPRQPPPPSSIVYLPPPPPSHPFQVTLHSQLPIYLSEPGINVGFGTLVRFAWALGRFAPELNFGWMVNSVDLALGPSQPLDNFWFGAGARYHFVNSTILVPFVGLGVQLNSWGATVARDFYVDDARSRLTFGAYGSAGLGVELSPIFALEAGATMNFTTGGAVFDSVEWYLSPFLGATLFF